MPTILPLTASLLCLGFLSAQTATDRQRQLKENSEVTLRLPLTNERELTRSR
jgi:hypothetical protein